MQVREQGVTPLICSPDTATARVLWVAPFLNHYKADVLDRLSERTEVSLLVFAGADLTSDGHAGNTGSRRFQSLSVASSYHRFGLSLSVMVALVRAIRSFRPDVVLMPVEKKFLPLIGMLWLLKSVVRFKLITLNHAICGKTTDTRSLNAQLSKLTYRLFDRVGFYTERTQAWAVANGLTHQHDSFFANNTLDTTSILQRFPFRITEQTQRTWLFIGRLIETKRPDWLLEMFGEFRKAEPTARLVVIGDGPMRTVLQSKGDTIGGVEWKGVITDQAKIGALMSDAHIVVVPGASGLSIVNAFCFGKPYATCMHDDTHHGPEIDYLLDQENGLRLTGDVEESVSDIANLLNDEKAYARMCRRAYETAQRLSVENWCDQMVRAFSFETKGAAL